MKTLASVSFALIVAVAFVGIGWIAGTIHDQWRQRDWHQGVTEAAAKEREANRALMAAASRQATEIDRLRALVEIAADVVMPAIRRAGDKEARELLNARASVLRTLDRIKAQNE